MRLPRTTTRRVMIAVAILAPFMAAGAWLLEFGRAIQDFYGPEGPLALQQRVGDEISSGAEDLRQGLYLEAESHYKAALALNDAFQARWAAWGWKDVWGVDVRIGLANALAGQGRLPEAEPIYYRSLELRERNFGPDHLVLADVLEPFAALLLRTGRAAESRAMTSRALKILDHYAEILRRDGRNAESSDLEARARALRESVKQEHDGDSHGRERSEPSETLR